MHALTWLATTPTPTPSPTPPVDPDLVTPGVGGFIAIAVIAIAVILLLIDMLRRIRRGRYRSEIAEQLDAEAAQAAEAEAAQTADAGRDDPAPDVNPQDPARD